MPPLGATPALAAGLVAFAWLLDGTARFRTAFLTAFAFAFGFFAAGLYWVAGSFFTVGGATAAGGPAAVLGLAGLLSCFLALPVALAHRLTQPGIGRALALAAALGLGDWLRGHLLTGFPWNLFGYAWLHVPAVEQAAATVGIYGIGLATLAVCLLLSVADWRAWTAAAWRSRDGRLRRTRLGRRSGSRSRKRATGVSSNPTSRNPRSGAARRPPPICGAWYVSARRTPSPTP